MPPRSRSGLPPTAPGEDRSAPRLEIPALAIGDRVQHPLLVRERHERSTRGGSPYVVLLLGNASGSVETAPIWSERLEWADGAEPGRLVQAIGDVIAYGESSRRQLQLSAPLRVLPSDGAAALFLERVDVPAERLWDGLDRLRLGLRSDSWRTAVDALWGDDAFRASVESAPRGPGGADARLGALLLRTLEVATAARHLARTVRLADVDLVVAGGLLHDVGRSCAWVVEDARIVEQPAARLLPPGVLGLRLLESRWRDAGVSLSGSSRDALLHTVLAADAAGGVRPRTPAATCIRWAVEGVAALSSPGGSDTPGETGDDPLPFRTGGTK